MRTPSLTLALWLPVALLFVLPAVGAPDVPTAGGTDASPPAPAVTSAPPLQLQPLITASLEENPELKAMRDRSQAAQRVPSQAGSLPDPKVGVAISNVPVGGLSFDQSPMSGIQLSAMQMVPYPGKLGLRREVAQHAADATVDDYNETKNEVVAKVKKAYYDLFFLDKAIAITLENQKLLEDFEKIAEVRYSVGKGVQQHVLRAQVALSDIVDDLIKLKQQRVTAQARLNTLLNRPPNAPLGTPVNVKEQSVPQSVQALYDAAIESRPMLAGTRNSIRQVETSLQLANKDLKPDFEFGAGYRIRADVPGDMSHGSDFWSFSASVILPYWADTKQKMRIKEVESMLAMWKQRYDSAKNEVFFDIRDEMAEIQKLDRQIDLFKTGIIPQAEIALGSAQAAYGVGQIDFLSLLDSQQILYKYQIKYYRVLADHEKAVADLEQTIGQRFS